MSTVAPALTLIPVTLALVLIVSAIAKFKAPQSTASAVHLLRLPSFLGPDWVKKALPPGELVLAVALLSPWLPLARLASVAGLLLFLAYWVIIARAMRFNPRPSCGCFGQIGDQRVSWKTVIRNTLLVAGAALFFWMTWSQGVTAWSVLDNATSRELTILASAAFLALLLWFIVAPPNYGEPWWRTLFPKKAAEPEPDHAGHDHSDESFQSRFEPSEPDEFDYVRVAIPDAILLDDNRNPITLQYLVSEQAALLIFVTCSCGSTHATFDAVPRWAEQLPQLRVVVVETAQQGTMGHDGIAERLYYDPAAKAYSALDMPGTSSAVLLGADGLIAGGPVQGNEEIEAFVAEIAEALSGAEQAAEVSAT